MKKKGNNMYVSPYSKNHKAKQAQNEVNYATADEQHQMEYGPSVGNNMVSNFDQASSGQGMNPAKQH